MRRPLIALVVSIVASASAASAAQAAISWAPCAHSTFQCAKVPVPLDPSGATPGTITLTVERKVAASNPTNTAIVALAGGPGQAAVPLDTDLADTLKPGLANQDLIIFDQRGTGSSAPLKCDALAAFNEASSLTALATDEGKCANEVGSKRAFFTTTQSVADIEALRVDAGYSKLVMFGVSYGTKVAEEYAQTYPQNTAGLILDSVVTPTGPDPFGLTTFAAIPRVLNDLCADHACAGATPNVNADLAAVLKHTSVKPYRGTAVDGFGRRVRVQASSQDIFGVLLDGDLDPTLRSMLPAALHGAREGDTAPLLRLVAHSDGLNSIEGLQSSEQPENDVLFLDTTCEESLEPWPRTLLDPTARRAAAKAAIATVPASAYAPFSAKDVLAGQSITLCLGWPPASPAPPTLGPLPPVHTLIIEGQADLRTTVADAQSVAAAIPGSSLIVVPHNGHSVLGTDPSGCATAALKAYFANATPQPCPADTPNEFLPEDDVPTSLAHVPGSGKALKTILAARETIVDEIREFISDSIEAEHSPDVGSRVGGLRGGFSELTVHGVKLSHVTFVPGVTITGTVSTRTNTPGTVHVTGSSAAKGTIKFKANGTVTATLGGHHISAHLVRSLVSRAQRIAITAPSLTRTLRVPLSR